ncbi:MAG: S-methyl-5-thioribose-1-phosphate isomerase [Clostridia bacterium]|nr:S-methyl-5-thioribose-1-phosphate isomerase [Clostridia bacterium]
MLEISGVKFENEKLIILDQTKLPNEEVYCEVETKEDVWDAIKRLAVRGAPLIGVFAAYGMYISTRDFSPYDTPCGVMKPEKCSRVENIRKYADYLKEVGEYLKTSRPTAVNLSWAVDRITDKVEAILASGEMITVKGLKAVVLSEAREIEREDIESCRKMGEYGLSLLKPGMGILTHCNAGTLATSKYGTCISPIYLGQEKGYDFKVYSDETRPLLQGARLTSWELHKAGVDVTLICDNMASIVMKEGKIDAVVVGCDRMASNGDGANKIGTSGVAILAHEYGIPFYMYVPTSTIDMSLKDGSEIPIEKRDGEEICKMWYGKRMGPDGVKTYNPAFDVTDNKYITAVVTEKGIVYPPYSENLKKIFE